jgi:hypothetical protein
VLRLFHYSDSPNLRRTHSSSKSLPSLQLFSHYQLFARFASRRNIAIYTWGHPDHRLPSSSYHSFSLLLVLTVRTLSETRPTSVRRFARSTLPVPTPCAEPIPYIYEPSPDDYPSFFIHSQDLNLLETRSRLLDRYR